MDRDFQIEAYVNGDLSGEARLVFEREMAADASLRLEIEKQKTLVAALRELQIRQLANRAHAANRKLETRRRLVLAAAILLIGGLAVGLAWHILKPEKSPAPTPSGPVENQPVLPQNPTTQPEKNIDKKPAPPVGSKPVAETKRGNENPPLMRGEDGLDSVWVIKTSQFFVQNPPLMPSPDGWFQITPVSNNDVENDTLAYLQGIVFLKNGQPSKAAEKLLAATGLAQPLGDEAAFWLALAWLQTGKSYESAEKLKRISSKTDSPRRAAAVQLLNEIPHD